MPAHNALNIAGQRFGRVTAIERIGRKGRMALWSYRCDCGTIGAALANSLARGNTKSCGCLKNELAGKRFRRHGLTNTPEHRTWRSIKYRCHDPDCPGYARYGGRGIKVCDRWRDSFENFLADMGKRPSAEYSIERVNNDGDYEPGNCKWATRGEQRRNASHARIYEFNGKRQVIKDWANEYGFSPTTLYYRLSNGWSIERALTTPADTRRGPKTNHG
jgi:hypothetical protein